MPQTNGTITPDEALDLFLEHRNANDRSQETIELYRRFLSKFINWLETDELGLDDLTPVVVTRYLSHLRDERRRAKEAVEESKANGKPLSLQSTGTYGSITRALIVKIIRAWVNFLSDEDYHGKEATPIERFRVKVPSAKSPKRYCPPPEDVAKLFEVAESARTGLIVTLLTDTGLRRKELCGVRWKDVNWRENTIWVDKPKTRREPVYLGDEAKAALREFKDEQAPDAGAEDWVIFARNTLPEGVEAGPIKQGDEQAVYEAIKNGRVYRQLDPANVTSIMSRLSKKADLEKSISPHALRRYYCSQLLANGLDLYSIKVLMRHRSLEETEHYIADLPNADLAEKARLSSPFGALLKNGNDRGG